MREHHNESIHSAIQFDEDLIEPPVPMMIERMIEITGEFHHLVELIDLRIENSGDSHSTRGFHEKVQPVLTGLETEIFTRFHPDMEFTEMRLIVQDWIDAEIRKLRRMNA